MSGCTGFCRPYAKVFERPVTDEEIRRVVSATEPSHYMTTNEHLIQRYAFEWFRSDVWPVAHEDRIHR